MSEIVAVLNGWSAMPGLPPADYQGGWVEAMDLSTGGSEILYQSCDGVKLARPNDIVFDATGSLWFTDHGKFQKRSRDRGSVYDASPDGSSIKECISGLESPNGIGLLPDGSRLYVSETLTARIWIYHLDVMSVGCQEGGNQPAEIDRRPKRSISCPVQLISE
jgi:gluconolactonase